MHRALPRSAHKPQPHCACLAEPPGFSPLCDNMPPKQPDPQRYVEEEQGEFGGLAAGVCYTPPTMSPSGYIDNVDGEVAVGN